MPAVDQVAPIELSSADTPATTTRTATANHPRPLMAAPISRPAAPNVPAKATRRTAPDRGPAGRPRSAIPGSASWPSLLLTDLEQFETERSDLGEHTEELRLIGQLPGEHGLGSLRLRAQIRERAELGLAQQP